MTVPSLRNPQTHILITDGPQWNVAMKGAGLGSQQNLNVQGAAAKHVGVLEVACIQVSRGSATYEQHTFGVCI